VQHEKDVKSPQDYACDEATCNFNTKGNLLEAKTLIADHPAWKESSACG
jgi:hypothetical protein